MARKKNFITKAMQNWIIQRYGGGHRYIYDEESTKATGHIEYRSKNNSGCTLTINESWQNNDIPYIMVHISDNKGYIIRKDRYNFDCKDNKRLWFVETEERGIYYGTFKKVGETMARATKDDKIKELEKRLEESQKYISELSKRNSELVQKSDDAYANSSYRHQMQEQLDFYKTLADLNSSLLESANKNRIRRNDKVTQVFEDNKKFIQDKDKELEYWIGMSEGQHYDSDFELLRDKVAELEGQLEGKVANILARNEEIDRLQKLVAELQLQVDLSPKEDEPIEGSTADHKIKTLKFKLDQSRNELKKEKNRKYDLYIDEDKKTYEDAIHENHMLWNMVQRYNDSYDERTKEHEAEIEKLKEQIEKIPTTTALSMTEEDIRSLKDRCKMLQDQIVDLQKERNFLNGQNKQLRGTVQVHKDKIRDVQIEKSELSEKLKMIMARNSTPELITINHVLEDRIVKIAKSLKEKTDLIEEWKTKYNILEEQIATAPPVKPTYTTPGRPKTDENTIEEILQMRKDGMSYRAIAEKVGVSIATISNIMKKNK